MTQVGSDEIESIDSEIMKSIRITTNSKSMSDCDSSDIDAIAIASYCGFNNFMNMSHSLLIVIWLPLNHEENMKNLSRQYDDEM